MKRGDIVLVREPNTPAGKSRPCVIIQRSSTLDADPQKVTVCALTSWLDAPESVRPRVQPSAQNGIERPSAVEVDWVYTHPVTKIGKIVGALTDDDLTKIDIALRRWLDL